MPRVLTQAEKDGIRDQLYEFLDAAARHGQVCPTVSALASMLKIGQFTVENALQRLEDDGRIKTTKVFVAGVGVSRIVYIVATGLRTVPKGGRPIGKAARKFATYDIVKRAEGQARDRELYGPVLDDVTFLRRRGWGITREGRAFRVGNTVMDAAALVAKADRERRLMGAR